LEVLLGHMGGPFWSKKQDAAWSIPKGEVDQGEDEQAAARREFLEELGLPVPDGEFVDLGEARQSTGKVVTVWALEGDLDTADVVPGTFEMEWPRGSGTMRAFPEIDRAEWFDLDTAAVKLVKGQRPFVERLSERLAERSPGE
jgi:predicted NUDIX family NTP pyrophosphohydrolase